jgi:phosphoribosylformimino-5-aminoimidazole carboxamide ribotide isomerase
MADNHKNNKRKFTIFPAIDLKNGECVRLFQGDFNKATVFNENPLNQAQEFAEAGFGFLHLVNLDGAIAGQNQESAKKNLAVVKEIIANTNLPIQLGGGIRSQKDIEEWLKIGVNRVIIGTMVIENRKLALEICKEFGKQIVLGIDTLNEKIATAGWQKISNISPQEIIEEFGNLPNNQQPSAIVYTDISRDGTMQGLNIEATINIANISKIPIIASGGLADISEIITLSNQQNNQDNLTESNCGAISGVILGKAYYQNKIRASDLQEANFITKG